ncbi:MAG: lipocalin-like domain-containing protein [Pseudomonadota bacterium]
MASQADLLGSWRMLSWTRRAVATGVVTDALGPDPIGYIAYHADGRMMAYVQRRERPVPDGPVTEAGKAALFDSMLAYTAAYRIEGDTVIHTVDGSWNPVWGREPLIRPFALDGDRLVISGAPGQDPVTGEEVVYRMEFERVAAAP